MPTWVPTTGARGRTRLDDVLIVDLDVHLLVGPDDLAPYCDEPWRKVLVERQPVPPFGGGGRLFPNFPGQWEPRRPVALTPADMRADLDALSIDLAVLFPERFIGVIAQPNRDYAVAATGAYHRWLLDTYLRQRGLYGGLMAIPQDPEFSAREIERYAGEEQVVSVILPCGGTAWGDRRYDPIYAAAQAHGLAILFHAGSALRLPLPFDLRRFDTWFLNHTYSHSIAIMTTLTNLLSTGVPARFPRLRMIFIEAGISWVAHLMMRLDRIWEERRGDLPDLPERPSFYMRRQMFYATQPIEEPENLRDMADLIGLIGGEDSVVFASDYPHHDFDHPKKVFDIPVSAEVKRRIMGENALRALGIPTPSAAQRVPSRAAAAVNG